MNDMIHKISKAFDYERGKVIGIFLGIIVAVCIIGCEPKIQSTITGKKVSEVEFSIEMYDMQKTLADKKSTIEQLQVAYNTEVEAFNNKVTTGETKFEEVKKFKASIMEAVAGIATTAATGGTVSATTIVGSLITLAGVGGTAGGLVDSKRKNKVINELKKDSTSVV